ncbi:TlpA family protein disulfide reductase [Tautonia sociabilis]|uniref:TlpA family protein disulfide reductase n=1 Tax=Tautonia sociabilis TaxID=2080755 RepID=A0A432ME09_9BACT|nr:TlpA disulfide reductase family protein [Tautonia sociabilis]RUL83374.1 TlpA family protein disulfide reductase [Tautonia sociabilis]
MADPTAPEPMNPESSSPEAAESSPPSTMPDFLGSREPSRTPSRDEGAPVGLRILLMSMALLVAGFFVYREIVRDAERDPGVPTSTEYQWAVLTPDGQPADLSDYKGRPVLLNVWATWCGPCVMEMPSLVALSKRPELERAGVAVLFVSVDDGLEPVQGFLNRFDPGPANVLVAAGPPPKEFATMSIPATFIIAPDGKIVRREIGAMDWDTPEIARQLAGLATARPTEG